MDGATRSFICTIPDYLSLQAAASTPMQALGQLVKHAEEIGLSGSLLYFNHTALDPWVVTTALLQNSESLRPLVAAQPYMTPPYTLAKIISSIACLYGRAVNINLIAGATGSELQQVCDQTAHDERYLRLKEYAEIVRLLLTSEQGVTYRGRYYQIENLKLGPKMEPELMPEFFVAGLSDAGVKCAKEVADVLVFQPGPIQDFNRFCEEKLENTSLQHGIRIGIIARETSEEAWDFAKVSYPQSRMGRIQTKMRASQTDSKTNNVLAQLALEQELYDGVYWTGAFSSGLSNDPYLVGSYQEVADYLAQYLKFGVQKVIFNAVISKEELTHLGAVIRGLPVL